MRWGEGGEEEEGAWVIEPLCPVLTAGGSFSLPQTRCAQGACVQLEQQAGRGHIGQVKGGGMRTAVLGGQRGPAIAQGTHECVCAMGLEGGVCLWDTCSVSLVVEPAKQKVGDAYLSLGRGPGSSSRL